MKEERLAIPPAPPLAELPDDIRAAYVRFFPDTPDSSAQRLRADIQRHRLETDRAARHNEFVDAKLSHTIAERFVRVFEDWDALTQIHVTAERLWGLGRASTFRTIALQPLLDASCQ